MYGPTSFIFFISYTDYGLKIIIIDNVLNSFGT